MLRYELKYIIPVSRLDEVRSILLPFIKYDSFAKRNGGEYTVRSIYFDTPRFECYTTKIAGVKNRNKVRIRGYNLESPDSDIFFEIKKKFEHPIYKHRTMIAFKEMDSVFENGQLAGKSDDLNRFLYHVYGRQMKPVVTVIYEREAFEAPSADMKNKLRITFDKNLRALPYPSLDELYREEGAVTALHGHFILEIKFNHYMPGWLAELVHSMNIKRTSASKYCMSIDALEEVKPYSRFDSLIFSRFSPERSN
ncbi:MAG: polyphosphate polymerase domain-containing protein [Saprospiraceae bacterium]|nr:polyphosphate polymerase domain-containing protein [Saprospiraceae bacterium]